MRLDPQNLAASDSRMQGRDRVLDGLAEGDRTRDLRNLTAIWRATARS